MTRRPPWWTVASALAAPVFLIGGWTVAQAARDGFDPVNQTISALAAVGAPHRWIMTAGLLGVGLAHLVTAAGLPVRPLGRVVLALAGVATWGVAAFPIGDAGAGTSGFPVAHGLWATAAFGLLALWPVTVATRRRGWPVHPVVAVAVSVVSASLVIVFAVRSGGATQGAWERVAAAQQALWPLVVVLVLRAGARMRA